MNSTIGNNPLYDSRDSTQADDTQVAETTSNVETPMKLCIDIIDTDLRDELCRYDDENERRKFALHALKVGVIVLKQAHAEHIKQEGDRLIQTMDKTFGQYQNTFLKEINRIIGDYFDPKSGRFNEKVENLVREDGELERVIRSQIEGDGSRLVKTLTEHVGKDSPVMQIIDPDASDGLFNRITTAVEENLSNHQKQILVEFSLDEKNSALSRLVSQITEKHDSILGELQKMSGRREEAKRGTQHGREFEKSVFEFISKLCQSTGDIATHIGNTTGTIKNNRKGDVVVKLGSESAASDAQIVIEAKESESYNLDKAIQELDEARKNRDSEVGLFVFSKQSAPPELSAFNRYGNNIVVVWDVTDYASDVNLEAGLSVAKALCFRARSDDKKFGSGFSEMEDDMHKIESASNKLADIIKLSDTTKTNADKIHNAASDIKKMIDDQISMLNQKIAALRS